MQGQGSGLCRLGGQGQERSCENRLCMRTEWLHGHSSVVFTPFAPVFSALSCVFFTWLNYTVVQTPSSFPLWMCNGQRRSPANLRSLVQEQVAEELQDALQHPDNAPDMSGDHRG